jgi:hypothetical protein
VRSDVRIDHAVSVTHQTAIRAVSSTATLEAGRSSTQKSGPTVAFDGSLMPGW